MKITYAEEYNKDLTTGCIVLVGGIEGSKPLYITECSDTYIATNMLSGEAIFEETSLHDMRASILRNWCITDVIPKDRIELRVGGAN